jgi:NADH-quinone oxidoreductase subunit F
MNLPPAEIYGVASFYGMFSLEPRPSVVIRVCDDIACITHGAHELCSALEHQLGPANAAGKSRSVTWLRSPCLGLCERAPAALISCAGESPRQAVLAPATAESITSALTSIATNPSPADPDAAQLLNSMPQSGGGQLKLLRRVGKANPESVEDYRKSGGYEALAKAIAIGPEQIVREVIESKLMGRGGAAFPTGKKW